MQHNELKIKSQTGDYTITFASLEELESLNINRDFCIIDKIVYDLYRDSPFFTGIKNPIFIEAIEENKTIDTAVKIIESLLNKGLKRGQTITVIGGGITQDLATFVSSILFRGVKWTLIPTTLLAQTDSCIGGKSSLNFKTWKNMLGNFYPPERIIISTDFLKTLSQQDLRSGIGEMIKVHMLSSKEDVNLMKSFLENIEEIDVIREATYNSLLLKKKVIEEDEFDTGIRLKMNLGHTFGHALEVATRYKIPHGLAVNIGLKLANYFSLKTNNIEKNESIELKKIIDSNLKEPDFASVNIEDFFNALKKDKKNKDGHYCFIIPTKKGYVEKRFFPMNTEIENIIKNFFVEEYNL